MPGVITCGLGDGKGRGFAVLRLVLRLERVVVFFFGAARLGFGLAAGRFGITCPSCCGNALLLSAKTSAREQSVRSHFLSPDQLMHFPQSISQISNLRCHSNENKRIHADNACAPFNRSISEGDQMRKTLMRMYLETVSPGGLCECAISRSSTLMTVGSAVLRTTGPLKSVARFEASICRIEMRFDDVLPE